MESTKNSSPIWLYVASVAVSLALLAGAIFGWQYTQGLAAQRAKMNFNNQVQDIAETVQSRLNLYTNTLISAKALFAASHSVQRNEFDQYFKTYNIFQDYPGISAVSFTQYVTVASATAFTQSVRSDTSLQSGGYPGFTIHPSSTNSDYYVLLYSEPNALALASSVNFGLDFSSNPARFAAILRAKDTGQPIMTEPTASLGTSTQITFVIFEAVYQNGLPLNTVPERDSAFFGVLNGVFQAQPFFQSVLAASPLPANFYMTVYDSTNTPESTLYSNAETLSAGNLSQQVYISVPGRTWSLLAEAPWDFGLPSAEEQVPFFILFFGIIVSILVFIVLLGLTTSRVRAVRLATRMTIALSSSEKKYRNIFESLQDVLYQTDLDGRITAVSPSIEKYIGIAPEKLVGINAETFYQNPGEREGMMERIKTDGSVSDYPITLMGKDHIPIAVSLSAHVIKSEEGIPIGIEGVLRDVTDRVKNETELKERDDELGRLNKIMIDRELKMVELKKEMEDLKKV